MKSTSGHKTWFVLLMVVFMVALTACTSGVSQEDYDAVVAERDQALADIDDLQGQISTGGTVDQQVVQSGVAAAPIEPVAIGDDGWTNAESVRGGLWLVATFDDYMEGGDAWDIDDHPRVYFTSESYASNYFEDTDEGKTLAQSDDFENFIGWHVIDAYSKEVVASALYSYEGSIVRGPHGVGVSPDGQWGYVGWSESPEGGSRSNYVGIVYIPTMKLAKILKQESPFEWGTRGQALHHIQAWTDPDGNPRVILQWGFGANGGPHHILDPSNDNQVWRSITYDDVKPMGHPFTTPSPDGQYVYISVGANWIRANHAPAAQIAKLDITSGDVTYIAGVGHHPIGITHSQDGRWTYVVDGHGSHVYMIDNETNEVVDEASAGVGGPYGICMNWDETLAFTVGKGEGSHNVGSVLGIMEITNDGEIDEYNSGDVSQPIYLGGSASSVDHCALHPDPDVNEVWVSNMKGWETIVVDLDTLEAEAWIPTPNGGDTHGMAFVWYDNGWDSGVLMSDMGGPKGAAMQAEVLARSTAAHADEG